MLNSSVQDIQNISNVDKKTNNISRSSDFWNNKIVHDGYLPLYEQPTILEYKSIAHITDVSKKLLLKSYLFQDKNGNVNIPYKYLILILPNNMIININAKESDYFRIIIHGNENQIVILKFPEEIWYNFNLPKSDLIDIVVKAKYYGIIPFK
ncbi:MAG TPA: hypothetical protein VLG50_05315 [Candidatus Saccharimonadales bacterium]|nr:hypothetical protein [Candidatus Saccharimonadales bacterium]